MNEQSCLKCKWFHSYANLYADIYDNEMEEYDCGKCINEESLLYEHSVDEECACNLFEEKGQED